jgi:hypothetical protein
MNFFIKESEIRPGNRGGRDQFKWDSVRLMSGKERECYLGASQSIGFLDKGGKWRKRDWWQKSEIEDKSINKDELKKELDLVKQEEQRLLRETLYPGQKEKKSSATSHSNDFKIKLSDYEMKEMLKKDAKFAPDDNKLHDFYNENEERKAGLGMKQIVSFRTKPYGVNENLSKLEGINTHSEIDNNPYLINKNIANDNVVNKYEKLDKEDKKHSKKKNKKRSRSRSRSKSHKKSKKSKKHKKRSRSRSRS